MNGPRPMSTPPPVGSKERSGYDEQVDAWARSGADVSGLSARVRSDVLARRAALDPADQADGPAPRRAANEG